MDIPCFHHGGESEEAGGVALNCDGGELDWSQIPMSVMLAVNNEILKTTRNLKTLDSRE